MRSVVMVAFVAAALSACNKPAAPSAPSPATDASGPAHQRAGLWQTSIRVDGHASPMAMTLCVDAAMAAKSQAFHPSGAASLAQTSHCQAPPPTRNLDGSYSVAFTCPMPGGGQSASKLSASGDWANGYHMHTETDTTGAPIAAENGHHVTDIDGKWLGPCPEGMAGGDMQLPGGMKISGGKAAAAARMLHGLTGGGSSSGAAQ